MTEPYNNYVNIIMTFTLAIMILQVNARSRRVYRRYWQVMMGVDRLIRVSYVHSQASHQYVNDED